MKTKSSLFMKKFPTSKQSNLGQRSVAARAALIFPVAFAILALTMVIPSARAQIQTAGDLFVNLDATTLPTGTLNDITNAGTLGGFFEAKLTNGVTATIGTNVLVGGVNGIQFSGNAGFVMQLVNGIGGALIPPPAGIVGSNATASIEVWAY
ncbi:MAG: hypothetical protein ACR2H1_15185, partial [Limisphaerales bacterium]